MANKAWQLPELISALPIISDIEFAIILLNQPIDTECLVFQKLFKAAKVRICADGGANQLYNSLSHSDSSKDFKEYLPEYICGDLDSLSSSVEAVYRKQVKYSLVVWLSHCDLGSSNSSRSLSKFNRS